MVLKPHLQVKRFSDNDKRLTTRCRQHRKEKIPWDGKIDKATRRCTCHVCEESISIGSIRLGLALTCHKGWKTAGYVHIECASEHPETKKLTIQEVVGIASEEEKNDSTKKKKRTSPGVVLSNQQYDMLVQAFSSSETTKSSKEDEALISTPSTDIKKETIVPINRLS